jgi:hypothetical protein
MYNRKKLANYWSGGIALLIKDNIAPYVKIDSKNWKYSCWFFTISKDWYGSNDSLYDDDLKCVVIYVPPLYSKFAHNDPFFEIQSEIFRYFQICYLDIVMHVVVTWLTIDPLISDMYDLQSIQNEDCEVMKIWACITLM